MNVPISEATAGDQPASTPPSPSVPAPPWLRYLTHVVALGWGTAELALWGARPQSLGFIGLVLVGSEGTRALAKIREALAA